MALDEQLLDDADGLAAADPNGTLLALASAGAQVRLAYAAATSGRLDRLTRDVGPAPWWSPAWVVRPSWATP